MHACWWPAVIGSVAMWGEVIELNMAGGLNMPPFGRSSKLLQETLAFGTINDCCKICAKSTQTGPGCKSFLPSKRPDTKSCVAHARHVVLPKRYKLCATRWRVIHLQSRMLSLGELDDLAFRCDLRCINKVSHIFGCVADNNLDALDGSAGHGHLRIREATGITQHGDALSNGPWQDEPVPAASTARKVASVASAHARRSSSPNMLRMQAQPSARVRY